MNIASRNSGRLVVVGRNSFLGKHIKVAARKHNVLSVDFGRDDRLENLIEACDTVVTCAIHPLYKSGNYDPAFDCEWIVAQAAARAGARVIMLSSRKVYGALDCWGANESLAAVGDGSHYGRNKAITEERIRHLLGDRSCVLRLSNAFGYEYTNSSVPRRSFFGLMTFNLVRSGVIVFDMNALSRRDFVPVQAVARAIIKAFQAECSGIFNVGSGVPLSCGLMATTLIESFGEGRIIETSDAKTDEFYLDVRKWTTMFGPPTDESGVIASIRVIGEQLACVRSSSREAPASLVPTSWST